MANPFSIMPLKTPTFFQKLFKIQPRENAFRELNNRLVEVDDVRQIQLEELEKIAEQFKVNIRRQFKGELQDLYKRFLEFCLRDRRLSPKETAQLAHLKALFGLEDKIIDKIHREVAEKIYHQSVAEVIADGRVDPEEKRFLEELENTLKLPRELAQKIYSRQAREYLENYLNQALADERLSPAEERELYTIAENLHITLQLDEPTRRLLEKYRLFWLIENGDIPVLEPGINLQRREECYFFTDCTWYEYRRITRRINYGGPTFRLKLAKGIYWRVGSFNVQAVSQDVMVPIDQGRLFLTNKRLIFIGSKKSRNIRLNRVLEFTPYKNGVEIIKDAGKNPFFEFYDGVDIFAMILGRLLSAG